MVHLIAATNLCGLTQVLDLVWRFLVIEKCVLCESSASYYTNSGQDLRWYACPNCGQFTVSEECIFWLSRNDAKENRNELSSIAKSLTSGQILRISRRPNIPETNEVFAIVGDVIADNHENKV